MPQPETPGVVAPRRCRTVALVGPDGVGKTSVAQALIADPPVPMKYLYMGMSIESSNVALPTSRLAHWWKVREVKRRLGEAGKPAPEEIRLHSLEHRARHRGRVGATMRLFRRVSEEAFRQAVSWLHQWRGFVVLYDRHFVFDSLRATTDPSPAALSDRIHQWFLRHLYPKPHLALFLDAPAPILLARKQEIPLERLELDRRRISERRSHAHAFVRVDASVPQAEVLGEVRELIRYHCSGAP